MIYLDTSRAVELNEMHQAAVRYFTQVENEHKTLYVSMSEEYFNRFAEEFADMFAEQVSVVMPPVGKSPFRSRIYDIDDIRRIPDEYPWLKDNDPIDWFRKIPSPVRAKKEMSLLEFFASMYETARYRVERFIDDVKR